MNLKLLKGLQILVGACVVGIVITFALSVRTAIRSHHVETQINPATIPTPATVIGR